MRRCGPCCPGSPSPCSPTELSLRWAWDIVSQRRVYANLYTELCSWPPLLSGCDRWPFLLPVVSADGIILTLPEEPEQSNGYTPPDVAYQSVCPKAGLYACDNQDGYGSVGDGDGVCFLSMGLARHLHCSSHVMKDKLFSLSVRPSWGWCRRGRFCEVLNY